MIWSQVNSGKRRSQIRERKWLLKRMRSKGKHQGRGEVSRSFMEIELKRENYDHIDWKKFYRFFFSLHILLKYNLHIKYANFKCTLWVLTNLKLMYTTQIKTKNTSSIPPKRYPCVPSSQFLLPPAQVTKDYFSQ